MLQPVENRIVVKMDTSGEREAGGIIIPETVSEMRYNKGTVVAVGPGKYDQVSGKRIALCAVEGDRIAFAKLAGVPIKDTDDVEYTIIFDSDIFVILK